ncbi:MBL fold metallo-hydrolase, partial [Cetobacterium sp.]
NIIEEREINIDEICEEKSFKQGETLEKKLLQLGIWKREEIILGTQKIEIEEIEIEVLSPLKKDLEVLSNNWDIERKKYINEIKNEELKSGKLITKYKDIDELINYSEDMNITAINKTSIVLLITIKGKKMLFTGDTSEENLKEALIKLGYSKENPIKLDLFKLPHHGSKNNMSKELIEMIDCKMYLVSTNGKSHGHPDKEILAKIIDFNKDKNIEIVFNYSVFDNIFSDKDKEKYRKFECKEKQIIQL